MEKQTLANKPHIMTIPYPYQGHMNPMLQFSKRLASKGVQITILATDDVKTSKLAHTSSINIEYISYEIEQGDEIPKSVAAGLGYINHKVLKRVPGIIEKHKASGSPIKVIVYDSLIHGALELAHKLGLRGASLFTQTCAVCSVYYHVQRGSLALPLEGHTVSLPSIPVLEMEDLPSLVQPHDRLYPGLLEVIKKQFVDLEKADWIFFNVFDKLEEEIAKWLSSQWPMKTIGPSIPSMFLDKRLPDDRDYGLNLFKPDAEACIKWLNAKATGSVVYISFGSVANLAQDHMDELAWGLLNTNINFLWVVRETEQNKLPGNFNADASEKGLVVSWCPQLEVLAHKAVGSFMTHCGWNSMLEALSLGMPMLVMPQRADQTTNAKICCGRMANWGLG
uniref:UGTPg20 n=1 Tax=Panax ginseng TaxID=4054 RepID=A0A0D5ZCR6_PANGI|nr:UGTPg20 [Panax ginseng]